MTVSVRVAVFDSNDPNRYGNVERVPSTPIRFTDILRYRQTPSGFARAINSRDRDVSWYLLRGRTERNRIRKARTCKITYRTAGVINPTDDGYAVPLIDYYRYTDEIVSVTLSGG